MSKKKSQRRRVTGAYGLSGTSLVREAFSYGCLNISSAE
jgi:hypothetical protein